MTHFTYMLIDAWQAKKLLSKHQLLAVILSAIAHDVDHPGNANQFEINAQSELSMMYKVQAVLESHHCATTFQVLRRGKNNFLAGKDVLWRGERGSSVRAKDPYTSFCCALIHPRSQI